MINILDEMTIDKIAAGEVVERPLNVVKELTENAIDAGASAITVEIKDGGSTLIRVTDNGCGIDKSEVNKAFMRHATSKIVSADDLIKISTLGFRGEALSSIAAVSAVEMISKTKDSLMGFRYLIEASKEIELTDIGAPNGTTIIVRNLFFNVPVRAKFLKSNQTEGSYVSDMMEHMAMSCPDISFKFINNGKVVFSTSGNGDLKEVIYRIYGKEINDKLIEFSIDNDLVKATGYLGKPEINRANRNFENYFINGRYVRCKMINDAVEEGYKNFLMQHKFPFTVVHFTFDSLMLDVNVHPQKMEVKISGSDEIYSLISEAVKETIYGYNLIPSVKLVEDKDKVVVETAPEPFEEVRKSKEEKKVELYEVPRIEKEYSEAKEKVLKINRPNLELNNTVSSFTSINNNEPSNVIKSREEIIPVDVAQMNLFDDEFLVKDSENDYNILGQIFKTYWLIGFKDKLFIMDQHAAHEKVKYEHFLKQFSDKNIASQAINPPVILSLTAKEEEILKTHIKYFESLGFEIEDFGLGSVAIRAFPLDLYGCDEKEFFIELMDELITNPLKGNSDVILNKLASMACKAAVKGNTAMSLEEVKALLDELLTLDNPYNCPHGRPTIISMTKYEIDKKFKRVVT